LRWKSYFGLFALIPALAASPALAGAAPATPARPFLARMNGPCPKKCLWIAVQGAIDKVTLESFETIVSTLGSAKPPVFFNSVGGDVGSAVRLGERIRELGLDTAIAATRVDQRDIGILGESPEDALRANVVVSDRGFCASACVFAFAGGVRRYAPLETSLGVHQMTQLEQDVQQKVAVFKRETVSVGGHVVVQAPWLSGMGIVERHLPKAPASDAIYEAAAAHLTKMGVDGPQALLLMRKMKPEKMDWLTPEQIMQLRFATERKRADALLD
jgi:hypothetical protein